MIDNRRSEKKLMTKKSAIRLGLLAALVFILFYIYGRYSQAPAEQNSSLSRLVDELNKESQGQGNNQENETEDTRQLPTKVLINVPFTSQAPFGGWADERQQDGCEEASVLMSMLWAKGESVNKDQALSIILDMAAFEEKNYGSFHDTSAQDTIERLLLGYYDYPPEKVRLVYDIKVEDIKAELADGHVVIVPADGQKLANPNFTGEGPERHMLLIRGYDEDKKQFITNDPGTRKGEEYKYAYDVLINAVRDYPTGHKVSITENRRAMIIVEK